jgi:dihydrofolate synthase/folylpolyglutamate synthase
VREGLTDPRWAGRLERFTIGGCTVIVDAAHNPAGARALASYVRERYPAGVTLVFGAMKDKAVGEMLQVLASIAAELICTTPPTPRALTADAVAALARPLHPHVDVDADPTEAVAHACRLGRTVVVAGSIFLVGPVRERLAHGILP